MMYHDCVVVPGWGALIAQYKPAVLRSSMIENPRRLIGFNASINHNDGLLATSIARRHSMSYEQACQLVDSCVAAFHDELAQGGEVSFGHLGYFRLTPSKKLEFMPTTGLDSHDEFYGLTAIEFKQLQQQEAAEPVITPQVITLKERMKVAAAAAAIVGLGFLFSTPAIVSNTSPQTASLNVVEIKSQPAQQVDVKPVSQSSAQDLKIKVMDDDSDEQATTAGSPFNDGMPSKGKYCLVINTCETSGSAQRSIEHYARHGIKAIEVTRGTWHHIVVAQSDSEQELIDARQLLPERYRRAWVSK